MSPRSGKSLAAVATTALLGIAMAAPIAAAHSRSAQHEQSRYRHGSFWRRHHRPNLALRLSGSPGTVNTGQQVTYTATVVNTGNRTDGNTGFLDRIPGPASLVSATPTQGSCSGSQPIVCNLGSLARGASATITIVVTANQARWMTDDAWVSTNPPRNWQHHHSARTQVQGAGPSLDLKLNGPGSATGGQQVTYTATVTNNGNATDSNAGFQDLLPGKAALVSTTASQGSCSGNPTIVCNLGTLNAGASATVTIVVTANQPGWMTDHGWVSTNPPGNWQHHRWVTTKVQTVNPSLDLQLSGSPGSVNTGQQVTYTAKVTNNGNGADGNTGFQDLLPGKATLVSTTASQGSCSGNPTVVCNLGSLNPGASATVTIVVTAAQPGKMTDDGWVSTNPPGNWQHHRSVDTNVNDVSPSLDLQLSGSPGTVEPGQQVTYTAKVTDNGNGADANAGFQDLLPGKATLVSTTTSQGSCSGNPTVVCNLGSLNPGASATVTIVVTAAQPGTMADHGWVSTNPPGNWQHHRWVNTSVRDVHLDLALRLSGSPGSVNTGQQVTYTATVVNTGNGVDSNTGFQDQLPANTTLVSATASQGSCSGNPTLTCNLGSLNPGASATITVVVTADQPGTITDNAWVSANPPGGWQHHHSVDTDVHAAAVTTTATTTATTTTTTNH